MEKKSEPSSSQTSLVDKVIEGNNSVLLDNGEDSLFYEKLSNTIHKGKREHLKMLQQKVELISYNPRFESETLKEKQNNAFEGLVLNITESCNLTCSYCIFSGSYENERRNNFFSQDNSL